MRGLDNAHLPVKGNMPSMKQRRPALDFAGAAAYTGFSERYLRRLVAERRIPHVKMSRSRSGRIYFDPAKLDEWMDSLAVPVGSP
jgi:excisionase family DNA binding protein